MSFLRVRLRGFVPSRFPLYRGDMPPDTRIDNLTREIDRLRAGHQRADHQQQDLLLKITEVQLNLALQDKTLAKLETAIHGNGKPGLLSRMDRLECLTGVLTKAVWLLTTAVVSAAMTFLFDRFG
jgi:hypothetical protein